MNNYRHSFVSDVEKAIRQQRIEHQITGIALGLCLVTGGNGLAILNSDEIDFDEKSASDVSQLPTDTEKIKNISVSPVDIGLQADASSVLISKPRPIPQISFQTPIKQSIIPKSRPIVTSKPTPPGLASKVKNRSPVAAIKQRPASLKRAEVQPMSDMTKNNLDNMDLSAERYQSFVNTIDTSHLDFAQSYTTFNPDKVAIEQRRTEFFTLHYTAFYSNFGKSSKTEPVGDMDVRKLIDSMGSRGNVCCGINWILARNGKVFQTAPVAAKLRHNPPFDSITTGVEVEASNQEAITSEQYETLSYLTIAVLKHQGLLDEELERVVHGHGEDRDKYRQNNPESNWDVRNDFDSAVSKYFRSKVALFLNQNQDIKDINVLLK